MSTTNCPYCGKIVGENDVFCQNCGRRLAYSPKCPVCGNELKNAKYCSQCGYKIKGKTSDFSARMRNADESAKRRRNVFIIIAIVIVIIAAAAIPTAIMLTNQYRHNYVNGICTICGRKDQTIDMEFKYRNDDKSYVLAQYIGSDASVEIPSKFNDGTNGKHKVKIIGSYVFGAYSFAENNDTLIYVSKCVEEIDYCAFDHCENLKNITIPSSVKRIGAGAFASCVNLRQIRFDGTINQWREISKDDAWDIDTGDYKVYCMNGTLNK